MHLTLDRYNSETVNMDRRETLCKCCGIVSLEAELIKLNNLNSSYFSKQSHIVKIYETDKNANNLSVYTVGAVMDWNIQKF